ncbi:hypothetical protein WJX73_000642 [Symbiochloris irregularis]|uniref:Sacsin/Nov domain-containing protein n=1 Tax=Symbiochloris irregularis TaxID=706552 RepID=A0AAW1P8Y9_9CHLO
MDPIVRLRQMLQDYGEGTSIFKELLQNADDAGAKKVSFCLDYRHHATDSLLAKGLAPLQGPALYAYNNAVLTEGDFLAISRMGDSFKRSESNKTGRFGVGCNAVYHITDVPSFCPESTVSTLIRMACTLPIYPLSILESTGALQLLQAVVGDDHQPISSRQPTPGHSFDVEFARLREFSSHRVRTLRATVDAGGSTSQETLDSNPSAAAGVKLYVELLQPHPAQQLRALQHRMLGAAVNRLPPISPARKVTLRSGDLGPPVIGSAASLGKLTATFLDLDDGQCRLVPLMCGSAHKAAPSLAPVDSSVVLLSGLDLDLVNHHFRPNTRLEGWTGARGRQSCIESCGPEHPSLAMHQ